MHMFVGNVLSNIDYRCMNEHRHAQTSAIALAIGTSNIDHSYGCCYGQCLNIGSRWSLRKVFYRLPRGRQICMIVRTRLMTKQISVSSLHMFESSLGLIAESRVPKCIFDKAPKYLPQGSIQSA